MSVVELTKKLISIKSLSGEEGEIANFICKYLDSKGVKCTKQPVGKNFNIIVPSTKQNPVCFNAHMDTVPPCDAWTMDPFKPKVEDGKLYGLGASDMKGALACMLCLAGNGNLFTFVVEEENTGKGAEELVSEIKKFDIQGIVIGEPCDNAVVIGNKSAMSVEITVFGKSAHASFPEKGVNANENMAKLVVALDEFKEILKQNYTDPVFGLPTLTVTKIAGGTQQNVVPDKCTVLLDTRSNPKCGKDVMLEELKQFTSKFNAQVKLLHFWPGSYISPDNSFVKKCLNALGTDKTSVLPFNTDAKALSKLGVPVISALGPGCVECIHSADEYVEVKKLEQFVKVYEAIS